MFNLKTKSSTSNNTKKEIEWKKKADQEAKVRYMLGTGINDEGSGMR